MFTELRFYQLLAEYLEHHYPDVSVAMFSPLSDCLSGVIVLEVSRPGVRWSFVVELYALRQTVVLDHAARHYARMAAFALAHSYMEAPTHGTHVHEGPHRCGPGTAA